MASEYTKNYSFDLYTDNDKPNLRDQYNGAITKIDKQLHANATAISDNATAIAAEKTRAEGAEQVNAAAIAAEKTRAEGAEQTNATAIADEVTRAETAEQTLQTGIDAEKTRAESAEQALSTDITNLGTQTTSSIEAEKTRATAAEEALSANIKNLGTFENAALVAIGDSWVNPTTDWYYNWVETCADLLGCMASYNLSVEGAGGGFSNLSTAEADRYVSFNAQVEYARNHMTQEQRNSVRYVAVVGGTNDFGYTDLTNTQWCNNVQTVLKRAQQTFPNAKIIHLVNNSLCIENPKVPDTKNDVRWTKLKSYIPDIYNYHLTYTRFDLLPSMLSGQYYREDWLHPSKAGSMLIAHLFAALFSGAKIAYDCNESYTGTYETNPTDNVPCLIHATHDGEVSLIFPRLTIKDTDYISLTPNAKIKTILGYVNWRYDNPTYTAYNDSNVTIAISARINTNGIVVRNIDSTHNGELTVKLIMKFKIGS